MSDLKISVLMPVYNGVPEIRDALQSILYQDYSNYEIVVSDNCSTDQLREVLDEFHDTRIKYFRNDANVGYGPNLERARQRAAPDTDILFLMGHDDILARGVLREVNEMFNRFPDVGAVTRGFFQFADDVRVPVRLWPPYDESRDVVLTLNEGLRNPEALFRTIYQLSGLAFRKALVKIPFHPDVMPAQAYPFFHILRDHPVVCLRRYTVAVRRHTSQARRYSSTYDISPTKSWITMVRTLFPEEKYVHVRRAFTKMLAQNFIGLVQIKNFSTFSNLLREYRLMVQFHWPNLLHPLFWLYVLLTLLMPRRLLLLLADWYKERGARSALRQHPVAFDPALSPKPSRFGDRLPS